MSTCCKYCLVDLRRLRYVQSTDGYNQVTDRASHWHNVQIIIVTTERSFPHIIFRTVFIVIPKKTLVTLTYLPTWKHSSQIHYMYLATRLLETICQIVLHIVGDFRIECYFGCARRWENCKECRVTHILKIVPVWLNGLKGLNIVEPSHWHTFLLAPEWITHNTRKNTSTYRQTHR
jgi:hypothetical protein